MQFLCRPYEGNAIHRDRHGRLSVRSSVLPSVWWYVGPSQDFTLACYPDKIGQQRDQLNTLLVMNKVKPSG